MRTRIVLIFVFTAVAAVSGCGDSETATPETRTIVAAFYPLAFLAEQLAPEADVVNITPAGAEPHDLELSARDAEAVHDADLVLYLGGGFQPALEQVASGHEDAVDLLEGESGADPHVWLDPVRFGRMARRVAGAAAGDPRAADDLVARLDALDDEFRHGLADCERREIVTSHAAFGYLAAAYDLRQIPLTGVSPEAEPSARDLEALVATVEDAGATTVFFETLVSPDLAETVAREAGATTAVLNPLEGLSDEEIETGGDYFSAMRANLDALRKALGCS